MCYHVQGLIKTIFKFVLFISQSFLSSLVNVLPRSRLDKNDFQICKLDSTDFKLLVYLEEKTSLKKSFYGKERKKSE